MILSMIIYLILEGLRNKKVVKNGEIPTTRSLPHY